jgi:chromosome segregation ATPase
MGLFKKRATDTEELEQLRSEIASMASRLDEADATKQQLARRLDEADAAKQQLARRLDEADTAKTQLAQRVDGLATKFDTPMAPPSEPPPARVEPADLDDLRTRLDRVAKRLDEVDQRITSISTELANQISELSGDLEGLGSNEPPTERVVDELRDAQERLANEQARYQIAFRQDLAELADRLKRS